MSDKKTGGDLLSTSRHVTRNTFEYDGGAARLGGGGKNFFDDVPVAKGRVERTMGYRISLDETFDIGLDAGTPGSESYHMPFDFSGMLEKVEVEMDL